MAWMTISRYFNLLLLRFICGAVQHSAQLFAVGAGLQQQPGSGLGAAEDEQQSFSFRAGAEQQLLAFLRWRVDGVRQVFVTRRRVGGARLRPDGLDGPHLRLGGPGEPLSQPDGSCWPKSRPDKSVWP